MKEKQSLDHLLNFYIWKEEGREGGSREKGSKAYDVWAVLLF
ncbi:MAG: hypothetical protein ACTS4V_01495 [Candidatus Hodgkinia cicadicola]